MAQISKTGVHRLINKCDKTFDKLEFNKKYPEVLETQLEEKNKKSLQKSLYKMKKRLLPLEITAMPVCESNKWLIETKLKPYIEKQDWKRREIEQGYLRSLKKSGEKQAQYIRDKRIALLDQALSNYKSKLEQKYPPGSTETASKENKEIFQTITKQEEEKLQAKTIRLDKEKQQKLDKVRSDLKQQSQKLQIVFDDAKTRLRACSKISEDDFGKDVILKIQNVKKYFGGIKAVDDMRFDIKEGEIFGLIGPNGAGKSTLFNCITQFYKSTTGNVFFRDRYDNIIDLTDYKTHEVIKTGIARTFQNLELVYGLSVMDNLLVGLHTLYRSNLFDQLLHTSKLKNEEKVNRLLAIEVMERLNLIPYKDFGPESLPYGVMKRLEVARTLMTKPRLIILDEPAAGLNDAETEELIEIIRKLRDDFHLTIFLVEHDMNLVMNVCDTVCATSFGKLLAIGTPEEIQANPLVQEAYLGEKEDA